MDSIDYPNIEVISFFPKDFFNKNVNEPFIRKIMETVLGSATEDWTPGDPNKFEPDYFLNGTPFEFTIASDSRRKNNFIQMLISGKYSSQDVETDVFSYISERVADKASKRYSIGNVHLCVLCLLDLFKWVSDEYGSITHDITDYWRQQFFTKLKSKYIDSKIFNNIFIIVPDFCAKWWVFDVLTGERASVQLTASDVMSQKYPYVIHKEVFDNIFAERGSE